MPESFSSLKVAFASVTVSCRASAGAPGPDTTAAQTAIAPNIRHPYVNLARRNAPISHLQNALERQLACWILVGRSVYEAKGIRRTQVTEAHCQGRRGCRFTGSGL